MASESAQRQFANKTVAIKLDETNFLQWKQQIEFTIEGLGLESHIDGTPPPVERISGPEGLPVKNPVYSEYRQADVSLASWLLTTISSPMLPKLVNCKSARSIWLAVQPQSSTTTIMRLLRDLTSQKKASLSMRDHISRIQLLCDTLASSAPELKIHEKLQIALILAGLGSEFESAITLITGSNTAYDLTSASNVLLDAEARLNDAMTQFGAMNVNSTVLTTSVVNKTGGSDHSEASSARSQVRHTGQPDYPPPSQHQFYSQSPPPSYQSGPYPPPPHGQSSFYMPSGQGQRQQGSYGRGRGNSRTQCQICGRVGHLAGRCWFRNDRSYPGLGTPHNNSAGFGQSASAGAHTAEVYDCGDPHCFAAHSDHSRGQASSVADSSAWFPDSGATNHLTNNSNNMDSSSSYTGKGSVNTASTSSRV